MVNNGEGPLVVHPANHWLWYLAQIFLGMSFIAPSIVALRFLLATGFLFLLIWSCQIIRVSVDSAVFAGTYCLINLTQALLLLWARRHITFDSDRESVYAHYFEKDAKQPEASVGSGSSSSSSSPIRPTKWMCSRVTWQALNAGSVIKTVRRGEMIATQGLVCNSFTFLLEGEVSYQLPHSPVPAAAAGTPFPGAGAAALSSVHIHGVDHLGVVDAVEFIHRATSRGAVWGINVVPKSDFVRLLVLSYDAIREVARKDMAIQGTLNAICGLQVASMLFATEKERMKDIVEVTGTANGTPIGHVQFHIADAEHAV